MKRVQFIKPVQEPGYFEQDHIVKLFKEGNKEVMRNLWHEFYPCLVLFLIYATNASQKEKMGLPPIVTAGLRDFANYMAVRADECSDYVSDLYRFVKLKAIEVLYTDNRREEIKSWESQFFLAYGRAELFRTNSDKSTLRKLDGEEENPTTGEQE